MRGRGGLDRNQLLMPTPLEDYIAHDNPVRKIDAAVDRIDLAALGFAEPKAAGRPPYAARDLIKLYAYGEENGITSSRKLEAETKRNLEVMWLLHGAHPDHKTIAEFRRKYPNELRRALNAAKQKGRSLLLHSESPLF